MKKLRLTLSLVFVMIFAGSLQAMTFKGLQQSPRDESFPGDIPGAIPSSCDSQESSLDLDSPLGTPTLRLKRSSVDTVTDSPSDSPTTPLPRHRPSFSSHHSRATNSPILLHSRHRKKNPGLYSNQHFLPSPTETTRDGRLFERPLLHTGTKHHAVDTPLPETVICPVTLRINIDELQPQDLATLFYNACEGTDCHKADHALEKYSEKLSKSLINFSSFDYAKILATGLERASNRAMRAFLSEKLLNITSSLQTENDEKAHVITSLLEKNETLRSKTEATVRIEEKQPKKKRANCLIQ